MNHVTDRIISLRIPFLLVIAQVFAAALSFAQLPASPAFEVASIRPTAMDLQKLAASVQAGEAPNIGIRVTRSQATYSFMTLRELIVTAYDLRNPGLISGPDWLSNGGAPRFDIVAKLPDDATVDQAPKMLQALLAERFNLVVHRETKDQSVMALIVDRGGPKLTETTADELPDFDPNAPLKPGERQMDSPQGPYRMTVTPTGGATINMGKRGIWTQTMRPGPPPSLHLEGKGVTMSSFAETLTQLTATMGNGNATIVDMTDLKGNYVVAVDFSIADLVKMAQAVGVAIPQGPQAGAGISAPDPGSSSVFDAVRALGLKLESRKAPQQLLIVDSVEKTPTAN
jgi:uncharacterized protein (TIGR03435 family)